MAVSAGAQTQETVDTFENGAVKARYQVDGTGRRHGPYLEHHPSGAVALRTTEDDAAIDCDFYCYYYVTYLPVNVETICLLQVLALNAIAHHITHYYWNSCSF